ncbi:hypothetical protein BJP05_09545 [Corynebacterium sp. NML98-0116]|uniref:Uncharacterized protein n=1 Tax=Corynebacterium lipophilum TaxID=2804918 RepID=A0AAW5HY14_9CORY|nr:MULTISPECIES: hypothetical protein [Corynebacterium]AOX06364.1 hypothetical protein BJP05_09545 [Corynebacterium sp. NML98-0116]MCO6395123.1 hypothetical protein [Corynebacterium lipophilum]MCQ4616788.1 hypothetical protein [Corynebacterium pseudogenitalium]MCZ2117824.1 hypothetical protein [Corynebacterium lipophilum]OIR42268.1 hypothetical protein BJP06_09040 [Corynebacterium sp. NML120713]
MSEDKQLTVAELLARAQKTNPDVGKRPRRRRSLEEGGVSVAELTGSFKAVDARPAEAKHSSVPLDAPAEPAPAKPEPAAEKPAAEKPAAAKPAAEKPVDPPAPAPAAQKASPSEDETTQIRVVEDTKEPAQRTKAEPAEKPAEEDSLDLFDDDHVEDVDVEKVEPEADDGAVNPIMLVLFVFIGVVLGVLGFMLFSWIWANLATALAAILGAAAVAGVVFGVRAMHTGRDGLTMTLAGVAALVMAFGPALL